MDTTAEHELTVNYVETAALATASFATPGVVFNPAQMQWFYEQCFAQGHTVIALRNGDRKVGQITMVHQTVMVDGQPERAAQLVDLFIDSSVRSRKSLTNLYDEVGRQFLRQDIRFAIGMPNDKAVGINAHFFQLAPFCKMPLCMGLALPLPTARNLVSMAFTLETKVECEALFSRYSTAASENGVPWDATALGRRLSGFTHQYGVHAVDDVLLISSPRASRGVPYTMLCGLFARSGTTAPASAVSSVVRAACAMWRRPIYAYAGINTKLIALPGITLPVKLRPSPLLIQLRDFKPDRGPLRLDRFQALDFDLG